VSRWKFLEPDERVQLLHIPTDDTSLFRIYTIPPHEETFIRRALAPHTMMDRAVHLALLKWPGTGFQIDQRVPSELVAFLAKQLKLSPRAFRVTKRDKTVHARTARDASAFLSMRIAGRNDIPFITDLAAAEAAHTDNPFKIVSAVLGGLRNAKVIIPAWDTIERACYAGLVRARESAIQAVLSHLTSEHKTKLDRLLINDSEVRQTRLAWLKNVKEAPRVSHLHQLIERRNYLQNLGIPAAIETCITPWQYARLLRRGNRARSQDIADYGEGLRYAVLATQARHLLRTLSDGGVDMFTTLTAGVFKNSEQKNERQFLKSKADSVSLAQAFHELVVAVQASAEHGVDVRDAVESTLGWDHMLALDGGAVAFADQHDQDVLVTVSESFGRISAFVPQFLRTFSFSATNPENPLLKAVNLVKDCYQAGRQLPDDVPVSFLPAHWQKLVKQNGKIDRKRYMSALALTVRERLRSGDLHVDGTSSYKPFDEYLVPTEQVLDLLHRLPFDTNPDAYFAEREEYLRERLIRFAKDLTANRLEGVRLVNGRLSVSPQESNLNEEVERIGDKIDRLMPRKQLADLFHELHADTGVFECFRDAEGRPHHDVSIVMSAVWALASGIGLERMADASPGLTLAQLEWAAATFITEENLDRAIAMLVDYQATLPFAHYSGDGSTSSSDGQFVPVGRRPTAGSSYNPKYGRAPGVKIYTHVNDQCVAYHTRVLSASAPEAPYVLDGLVFHGSGLVIKEHTTDTGGASDLVFAGCRMIDVRFVPRYRDLPDLKLGYIGSAKPFKEIGSLLGRPIRTPLIREYWPDILRMGVSFVEGVVRPSLIFRRLSSFRQQNRFATAFAEFGRIERTIFLLDWLEDPEIRRHVQINLNRGESQHFLSNAVRLGNQGRLLDRTQENQVLRSKANALVTAAFVCSNTKDLDPIVTYLASIGQPVPDEVLPHISPMGWKHITLTGQYYWNRPRKSKERRIPTLLIKNEIA